ncbi:MAG: DUF6478 family protein [Paracoccaceae bacterium]
MANLAHQVVNRMIRRTQHGTMLRDEAPPLRRSYLLAQRAHRRFDPQDHSPARAQVPPEPAALWAQRPDPWRVALPGLALSGGSQPVLGGVHLHHDCPQNQVLLRQIPRSHAPFAVRVDVFAFTGSYLSLTIALPKGCILAVDHPLRSSDAGSGFLRFNRKVGANVTRKTEGIALPSQRRTLIDPQEQSDPVGDMWLDLFLAPRAMSWTQLDDLRITALLRGRF